ncbi:hypothetical protein JD969_06160 [Planctomycetota bacterium]|nr:hypothetical protein JD969_06160 [Planctomycetota bacterium]
MILHRYPISSLLAVACLGLSVCGTSVLAENVNVPIFDWGVRGESADEVTPIPHAGHDWGALYSGYTDFWQEQHDIGGIVGVMLRNDTGPYDGTKDKDALSKIINWMSDNDIELDYVFSDFESDTTWENVDAMISLIRNHPNPLINKAKIGQYSAFAAPVDLSRHWNNMQNPDPAERKNGHTPNRVKEHGLFMKAAQFNVDVSGLNVAMPNPYPYEYFSVHSGSYIWDDYKTPNVRSSVFWAPIERLSSAKKNLPEGQVLIPWIAGFVSWDNYDAPEPNVEDRKALLQHMRLRGADGYYSLASGIPSLTNSEYRLEMKAAWEELDGFFDSTSDSEYLILDTDKTSGVIYSAVRKGNVIRCLVSNLSDADHIVNFPEQIPYEFDEDQIIATGTHKMFKILVSSKMDVDFEEFPIGWQLDTLGVNGPDGIEYCVKNSAYSGHNSDKVLTPVDSGYTPKAWVFGGKTGLESDDIGVYYAKMVGGNGVGFAPVVIDEDETENPINGVGWQRQGPLSIFYWGSFKVRPFISNGDMYKANNYSINANNWYEVKLVVEHPENTVGIGKWSIRNLTLGETGWTALTFDNEATDSVVEYLTSVPLHLSTGTSNDSFNGWYVYAYDKNSQIDDLKARNYIE